MRLLSAVSRVGVEALYLGHHTLADLAAREFDKRFAHYLRLLSTGRGKRTECALSFVIEPNRYRLFHGAQRITNVILERETGPYGPSTNELVEFIYRLG